MTTKVELYNGATLVATKTSAPFTSIDWTPASGEVGSATLTYKRYEDGGATPVFTSEAINGTVNAAAGDTTAPTYIATYPKSASITSTGFNVQTQLNEIGKTYMVVVPDAAAAPTSAQVKAGQNSAGAAALKAGNVVVAAASTTYSIPVTALTASTAYDVYVVSEDDEATPNLQATPTKLDVSTVAASGLTLVSSYPMTETTGNMIDTVSGQNSYLIGSGVTRDGIKYAFDGGVNAEVKVADGTTNTFTSGATNDISFEIETNVKFNNLTSLMMVLCKRGGSAVNDGLTEYQWILSSGVLKFALYDAAGNTIGINHDISAFTVGQEYLFKVVYDGSKSSTGLTLFIDGASVGTQVSAGVYAGMPDSATPLTIGGGWGNNLNLNGDMRNLKIKK